MNRHLFLLVIFFATNGVPTVFGANYDLDGTAIVDRSDTPAKVSLAGRLTRNSTNQPEGAPYILLDGWGMIQGYLSPATDLNLQPYLGRQVRIEGRATMPQDGGTPHVTVEALTTGDQKRTASVSAVATSRPTTVKRPVRQVSHYEAIEEAQGRTPLTPEPIDNGARKLSAPAGGDRLMHRQPDEEGRAAIYPRTRSTRPLGRTGDGRPPRRWIRLCSRALHPGADGHSIGASSR